MIFDVRKTGMTALVAMSLLCTSPAPASAQFGGLLGGDGLGDLTDILGDILDQAETIATAAEQIVASGAFNDLAPLLPELQKAIELLEQAETISFNVQTVLDDFEAVFPEDFDDFDLAATVKSIDDVSDTTREAVERALEIGADTVQSQLPTIIRTEATRAVGAAAGPAAALQALVQLQSDQIGQFSKLQTLLVTQTRILGLQASEAETARKRARRIRELDDPTLFATDEPVDIELGLELLN